MIREILAIELNNLADVIQLIISTENPLMWQLNWYAWDLLENNLDIGISFLLPQPEKSIAKYTVNQKKQVRILAVFGEDNNINLDPDWQEIAKLIEKGAEVFPLFKPTGKKIIEVLGDKKGWDIFFFAGHSDTQNNTELIYINEKESLGIDQFKNALREARQLGLQISIFNSCKGLGLATKLAALQIPVIIVMQDVVPDVVAQCFLKEFLEEYANGAALHTAVRRAQSRLEKFTDLPGATWLPVIFQSYIDIPPTWQDFFVPSKESKFDIDKYISEKQSRQLRKPSLRTVLTVSSIIAVLIIALRTTGLLESVELQIYDNFMFLKPIPALDERILLVGINDHDVNSQNFGKPLQDKTLEQLLAKLEKYQPTVIGLDIDRYKPTNTKSDWENLGYHIQNSPVPIMVICVVGELHENYQPIPAVPTLPGVSAEHITFSDGLMLDSDSAIRRYSLVMDIRSESSCNTSESLSFGLVKKYLATKHDFQDKLNPGKNLTIQSSGKAVSINVLKTDSGGYRRPADEMLGYQMLINYPRHHQVAQEISLSEIMKSSDADLKSLIHDRIILIGYTAKNSQDINDTPVGKMHGVRIHANVISQLLNALEKDIPLLSYWTEIMEKLWIFLWAITGGLLIRFFRTIPQLLLFLIIGNSALFFICFVYFLNSVWVPIIPPALSLMLITLFFHFYFQTQLNLTK